MATSAQQMSGRALWFWWTLATAVGITVASLIVVCVVVATSSDFWILAPGGILGLPVLLLCRAVTGSVVGVALGAAQYPVLRRRIRWARQWLLASTVGMAIGGVFALLATGIAYDIVYGERPYYPMADSDLWGAAAILAIDAAVAGTTVGIVQWVFLRRWIGRAGWWILASALAWSAAMIPGQFGGMALFKAEWVPPGGWQTLGELFLGMGIWGAMGLPIVGLVVGAITGLALVVLLKDHASEQA